MKMTPAVVIAGAILVFLAVVMAAVFIPGWVWAPPETWIAHPYTDLEEQGRVIFYSNGCNYCHTQYVRYFDTGNGPLSMGGNYVYDNPMILGSERTGPDLSYIGRKRSEAWEIRHWKDPREMSPLSIMPSFEFLSEDELKAMSAYLFNLGTRESAQWMIQPPFPYSQILDAVKVPNQKVGTGATPVGWPHFDESGLQAGKELYISHCLTCHGCAGNGLGHYAGAVVVTPADYKVNPFRDMPDDEWFWHVSEGVQGTVMPTWKESLTEEERWQVIRYIQQIYAHPMERDPDEGDPTGVYANLTNPLPKDVKTLEDGKHIWTRECWVCHGDAATGHGIYRAGIEPVPPDFSVKSDYANFTDSDYYWRISRGVPWTAMPTWEIEYSEPERWSLVYYIRVNFTQTEPRPVSNQAQVYPPEYLAQEMPQTIELNDLLQANQNKPQPVTPNFEYGKTMFAQMCAHCHGLSGVGDGWDGKYLDVPPANFTTEEVRGLSDGDWFARVSYGIQNSAMPTWGEWMPFQDRWSVIKFLEDGIVANLPASAASPQQPAIIPSAYDGTVSANFVQASTDLYISEIGPISVTNGANIYQQMCLECHGADGKGQGPGTVKYGIPSPAPFPTGMSYQYILWRAWDGVEGTIMPGFHGGFATLLDEGGLWDVTMYVYTKILGNPFPSSGG